VTTRCLDLNTGVLPAESPPKPVPPVEWRRRASSAGPCRGPGFTCTILDAEFMETRRGVGFLFARKAGVYRPGCPRSVATFGARSFRLRIHPANSLSLFFLAGPPRARVTLSGLPVRDWWQGFWMELAGIFENLLTGKVFRSRSDRAGTAGHRGLQLNVGKLAPH
jgi:hypothetical protein